MRYLRPYAWVWTADGAYYDMYNGKKPSEPPDPFKKKDGKWIKMILVPYKPKKRKAR